MHNQRLIRRTLHAMLLSVALFLCAPLHAQQPADSSRETGEVSRLTVEVSNEIYSPFCPGKTLMMCPSPNAAKVRRDIQDLAKKGLDKEEIKNQVVATYGEQFRIVEPPPKDNMMLIVLILIALVLAVVAVAFLSKRKKALATSTTKQENQAEDDTPLQDLSDDEKEYLRDLHIHLEE